MGAYKYMISLPLCYSVITNTAVNMRSMKKIIAKTHTSHVGRGNHDNTQAQPRLENTLHEIPQLINSVVTE